VGQEIAGTGERGGGRQGWEAGWKGQEHAGANKQGARAGPRRKIEFQLAEAALKFCQPSASLTSLLVKDLPWASENDKLLVQQEVLLVPDDRTALFFKP